MYPFRQLLTLIIIAHVSHSSMTYAEGNLNIELNKSEQRGNDCRIYLYAQNNSKYAFNSLKLDLVIFNQNGIINKNMALNLAPLPATKKSVKAFDLKNTACKQIGSILINKVMQCGTNSNKLDNCLQLLSLSSKTNTRFTL